MCEVYTNLNSQTKNWNSVQTELKHLFFWCLLFCTQLFDFSFDVFFSVPKYPNLFYIFTLEL